MSVNLLFHSVQSKCCLISHLIFSQMELFDGYSMVAKKKENEVNRNVEAPFLAGGPQFWERAKRCKTPVAQSAAQFKCDFN